MTKGKKKDFAEMIISENFLQANFMYQELETFPRIYQEQYVEASNHKRTSETKKLRLKLVLGVSVIAMENSLLT